MTKDKQAAKPTANGIGDFTVPGSPDTEAGVATPNVFFGKVRKMARIGRAVP
jgi:hypothetical protein